MRMYFANKAEYIRRTVTVEFSQRTDVRVLCATLRLEEHKNCEHC